MRPSHQDASAKKALQGAILAHGVGRKCRSTTEVCCLISSAKNPAKDARADSPFAFGFWGNGGKNLLPNRDKSIYFNKNGECGCYIFHMVISSEVTYRDIA
jgi:hypothetical protein